MSKVFACTFAAGFLFLRGPVRGEELLVAEGFESAAPDGFPETWNDLQRVVGHPASGRTLVQDTFDVRGDATRAVQIRSLAGTSQGIYRWVAPQKIYRVEADVYIEADSNRLPTNIPIDVGFAVLDRTTRPFDWRLGSVYVDGPGRLEWNSFSTESGGNLLSRFSLEFYRWYRVSLELDTENGRLTSRVLELSSGREVAVGTFLYGGVLATVYDTVYIAAHQMAGGNRNSSVLVDNIVYSNPGSRALPSAVLQLDRDAGIAPLTVTLDASPSRSPNGEIVLHEWDLGDGSTGTGERLEHTFLRPGPYTVELRVEDLEGRCATARRYVTVEPDVEKPPSSWLCDDFDSAEPGEVPADWEDLSGLVGEATDRSRIVPLAFAPGRALEIRSEVGTTQGVYRGIEPAAVYRLELDLEIVESMDFGGRNLPVDLGFAVFDDLRPPYFWKIATVFSQEGLWKANASPTDDAADWSVVGESRQGVLYRIRLEVDTRDGCHTVRVRDLARDEEIDFGSFRHEGVIGVRYDTVYIASHHLDPSAWTGTILVDNVCFTPLAAAARDFRRGDSDSSGAIDISDPIFSLTYQFVGGIELPCEDAADVDDSGEVDISDPIFNLLYQFVGDPPPAPGPLLCGPDPTADALSCGAHPGCEGP